MQVRFLGTGSYHGTPNIFCDCETCQSGLHRLRSTILVSSNKTNILLDCSPDIRKQVLKFKIDPAKINAIFISHADEDHMTGLMEFFYSKYKIKVFYHKSFLRSLLFRHILTWGGKFSIEFFPYEENEEIRINDLKIRPVRVKHAELGVHKRPFKCFGFSIASKGKSLFYTSDTGKLTSGLIGVLKKHDFVIIDGTSGKKRLHKTHLSVAEVVNKLKGMKNVYFTHISDRNDMQQDKLPKGFYIANDGNEIEVV